MRLFPYVHYPSSEKSDSYGLFQVVYRAMGAKIGKRIYWPGSGISCADPELLEIGDDVVFGSRSSLVTTDRIGSGRIIIERGGTFSEA